PWDDNEDQIDSDGDGYGDACDLCPGEDDEADDNGNGVPDCQEVDVPVGLVINEIRIDQGGSDNDEYFELKGAEGTDLSGLTYIVIGDGSGGSGHVEAIINLDGVIDADGLFVVAEDTFSLAVADQVANVSFENSDNVTHLLVTNYYGGFDDLDVDDDGQLDSAPWLKVIDHIALIETPDSGELVYSDNQVGPTDDGYVPGHAYRCSTEVRGEGGRSYGACCHGDGTCSDNVSQHACDSNGGTWLGPNSYCSQTFGCDATGPKGACCYKSSICYDNVTSSQCGAGGDEWSEAAECVYPFCNIPPPSWTIGEFDLGVTDTPGDVNPDCESVGCAGDYDGSGAVDVSDLLLVISEWGTYDVTDLLLVISDWGCEG
ncbi:MAG: hypothetical protein P8L37_03275, partial [Phycisphaerales bacterium]|nr:hypothetical protein [Phycisphaerales bacterium]